MHPLLLRQTVCGGGYVLSFSRHTKRPRFERGTDVVLSSFLFVFTGAVCVSFVCFSRSDLVADIMYVADV